MAEEKNGCIGVIIIIGYIGSWIGSGVLAWNWVEPQNFWGAILFIFVWGILGAVLQLLGMMIVAGLMR